MTDYQHGSQQPADAEQRKRYEQARDKVAAMKGFYIHLLVFVAVIVGLLVINVLAGDAWWVQWVFIGWGIGVLAHAFAVFGRGFAMSQNWERRKIKDMMDKR